MSKQVTRGVPVYRYTFMKVKNEDGKMIIVDTKAVDFFERMGDRKIKEWRKTRPDLDGYVSTGLEIHRKMYAMDLDKFLAEATEII